MAAYALPHEGQVIQVLYGLPIVVLVQVPSTQRQSEKGSRQAQV